MSLEGRMLCWGSARSDKRRDSAIAFPEGVTQVRDISYGPYGKSSLLDVYFPEGTEGALPTIVSIHGGGYVYGSKEIYHRYCMDLARRGFTQVEVSHTPGGYQCRAGVGTEKRRSLPHGPGARIPCR